MKKMFTLIELLIVIVIIAILISLLMPSLSRAKKKAKTIACMNNLKQIGFAFNMYVKDNMNKYPYGAVSTTIQITWDDLIGKYDGRSLDDSYKLGSGIAASERGKHSLFYG